MRRTYCLSALLTLVFWLGTAGPSPACPNCKEAVAAQPSELARMSSGYNWSVLLMLATPFTLLGTGAFAVVRAARRGALPEM